MKAQILSSQHTVMIEGFQIDLFYDLHNARMELFIDGAIQVSCVFRPNKVALNYSNILEVAIYYYERFKKAAIMNHKRELKEFGFKQ